MGSVITRYRFNKGFSIDKSDIDRANRISFFFSSTTYAYLWGLAKYAYCAETRVDAFELYGVRLPDTESYLNTDGISLKIKSGYRYDDTLVFPVAYEFVIKGDSRHEVTLGLQKRFCQYHDILLKTNLIIGSGVGLNVAATYPIHKHFAITGGLEYFNANTLHGERNITRTSPGIHGLDAWLKVSLVY